MSAVAQSCNCYFYNLATNISIESMAECAHILGLDSSSALFLGKESFGIMPSKKWKYKNFGIKWTMGDTFNTIIGQGYVEMSPMQLVVMIARVASGKILTPSIFLSHSKNVATLKDLNIDKNCLQILRRALREVFSSSRGLCRYHDSRDPKYMIAGKTGTAQVVSRRIKHHANEKNKFIAHALFVGYVPFLDPKFAISAIVEHGASGTSATALAKKILHFAVDKSKN